MWFSASSLRRIERPKGCSSESWKWRKWKSHTWSGKKPWCSFACASKWAKMEQPTAINPCGNDNTCCSNYQAHTYICSLGLFCIHGHRKPSWQSVLGENYDASHSSSKMVQVSYLLFCLQYNCNMRNTTGVAYKYDNYLINLSWIIS